MTYEESLEQYIKDNNLSEEDAAVLRHSAELLFKKYRE